MNIPAWAIKGLVILAIVSAIGGAGWAIHNSIWTSGFNASKAISDLELAEAKDRSQNELDRVNNWWRMKELKLTTQLADLSTTRLQEKNDAKITMDKLRADLRSSAVRLSIPVKPGSCSHPAKDSEHSTIAGQSGGEVRADILPEASVTLIDIAADGDDAMRKHAAVVDAYELARTACNKEQE